MATIDSIYSWASCFAPRSWYCRWGLPRFWYYTGDCCLSRQISFPHLDRRYGRPGQVSGPLYWSNVTHSCRVPHFQVLENMHAEYVRVAIFSWHFRVTHFVTLQGFRADSGSYKQHSAMVCSIARLGLLYYNHGESGSPIRQEVSRFFVIMCTFWLLWYCIMVFLQFFTTRLTRITFSTFSVRLRYLVSNILTHAGSVNGWS
jgi:hypothetical protein